MVYSKKEANYRYPTFKLKDENFMCYFNYDLNVIPKNKIAVDAPMHVIKSMIMALEGVIN